MAPHRLQGVIPFFFVKMRGILFGFGQLPEAREGEGCVGRGRVQQGPLFEECLKERGDVLAVDREDAVRNDRLLPFRDGERRIRLPAGETRSGIVLIRPISAIRPCIFIMSLLYQESKTVSREDRIKKRPLCPCPGKPMPG